MLSNDILLETWTDDFFKEQMDLPRIWINLDDGIEIQELKINKIDEIIKIIEEYYIIEEPSMSFCQMHTDRESVEQYLYLARRWMMDTLSTVAVEQTTGNIVGFLICRFNEESNNDSGYSKERMYEGKIWNELQKFKHYLKKRSSVYKHYNVDHVIEIYSLFILPQYRRKGIAKALLNNLILRQLPEYEWFKINVITGVFTDKVSQHIAESVGMETLYDFLYAGWTNFNEKTENHDEFFKDSTEDNMFAKVMSMKVNNGVKSISSSVNSRIN